MVVDCIGDVCGYGGGCGSGGVGGCGDSDDRSLGEGDLVGLLLQVFLKLTHLLIHTLRESLAILDH